VDRRGDGGGDDPEWSGRAGERGLRSVMTSNIYSRDVLLLFRPLRRS
jgi:hypothetical protein